MNVIPQLLPYARKFRRELNESVIPFWLEHSPDWKCGGYFSCLDRDGTVYDDKKYMWLQGRFVWMYSRLYNEWERKPAYLKAAKLGADFIRSHGRDAKGRVFFSLDREGRPYFFQRKPYAATFVSMGLLEYSIATGDKACRREAADLFWRIKSWIENPSLIERPVLAGQVPMSGLANAMVLACMAIEFAKVDPDPRYRKFLKDCIPAILRHYEPKRRILLENVALDGRDLMRWPEGRFFNPGHSIEVAWFLLHLLEFHPDDRAKRVALDVLEGSLQFGWDRQYGGLLYFMDVENRPTLPLESSMKLWWPHTEAMYALVYAALLTGERRWLTWLDKVVDYCWAHFVDRKRGHWFGYCDRRGDLTHTCKGNNYKGFFHTPRALMMCTQIIEAASRGQGRDDPPRSPRS